MIIEDPIGDFLTGIRHMVFELNHNLESFKTIMIIQNTQNSLFIDQIAELKKRIQDLEDE
jgi:hypothetical protein